VLGVHQFPRPALTSISRAIQAQFARDNPIKTDPVTEVVRKATFGVGMTELQAITSNQLLARASSGNVKVSLANSLMGPAPSCITAG